MAVSFLKKGADAQEILKKEKLKADLREKEHGAFRFWLPSGGETQITFVDGELDANGLLDVPVFYEHNLKLNGKWGNLFTCTGDVEPCPICESGDNPACVAIMTIIDHSTYVSKKDGKEYSDTVKLFVMKQGTRKILQRLATKRGGLAGATFDVSRQEGDKVPAVGDLFDFSAKLDRDQLVEKWGKKAEPLNYEEEVVYTKAEDMRNLLGMSTSPANAISTATDASIPDFNKDL